MHPQTVYEIAVREHERATARRALVHQQTLRARSDARRTPVTRPRVVRRVAMPARRSS